ncbi:MAG TPA: hypothetical protein VKA01_02055 [Vicinamibacteria bacterium]|nr:hypothetical protein [Vicinamibacteria bacterium]
MAILRRRSGASLALAMALGAAHADEKPPAPETQRAIAGRPEYDTSWLHNIFMGTGYRKVWTTPIEFPVLDLAAFAGGLTPVRPVGSMQSIGLALRGRDGRNYTFRMTDKDPTRILPPEWAGTVPAKLFQDSTTANHPGNGFIVPPLAAAAGVPHATPLYVFMPDDAALGQFRKTFGGRPGTIEEYATPATADAPGFAGAVEILSTAEVWKRALQGSDARVDGAALLRARMLDLFLQDWDRHNKQWRWLRVPSQEGLQPLPEDRDQAFSKFDGLLLGAARATHPKFMKFSAEFDNLEGLGFQGAEIDRWMLSGFDRAAFARAAEEVARALDDATIEAAVKRLPPQWFALGGSDLVEALRKRRDGLREGALRFYARLARRVDVHGTDRADRAEVRRQSGGALEVRIALANDPGSDPYFERRFDPKETEEIRLYLYGGDDAIRTSGPAGGPIRVRVISGKGDDLLDDGASGGTRLYDFEGTNRVERGPGTSIDSRPWERRPAKPAETLWLECRDWGNRTTRETLVWWEPDPGLMVAGGLFHTRWGFRKRPFASLQHVQLQYSFGREKLKFNYDGEFRRENSSLYWLFDAQASGLESLNFFGFGNESTQAPPEGRGEEFYDAASDTYVAFPSLRWEYRRLLELHAGPEAKYTHTPQAQATLIGATDPYGSGDFGQVGIKAGFDLDTRGRKTADSTTGDLFRAEKKPMASGVRLKGHGFYYPEAWDATGAFGGFEGTVRGYWAGGRAELAARIGGRRVWGDYPWHEAAFVGGSKNVRGYRKNRFAGDGSLYGNLELRLWLFRGRLIAPGRWGVFGFGDAGRVYLDGEQSDKWHPAGGGGIFFQMLTLNSIVHAAMAWSDEDRRLYVDYGFAF